MLPYLNQIEWIHNLTIIMSKYFNRPYKNNQKESIISRIIKGKIYKVFRFNHGIIFSMRQALLAINIINLFGNNFNEIYFETYDINFKKFLKWIKFKINNDPYFKHKVMFTSAFQRSGRESEISSSSNPILYNRYEKKDTYFFEYEAKKYINILFKDSNEILIYKEAILWSTMNDGILDERCCDDLYYLRRILHAAHLLDLRRILLK